MADSKETKSWKAKVRRRDAHIMTLEQNQERQENLYDALEERCRELDKALKHERKMEVIKSSVFVGANSEMQLQMEVANREAERIRKFYEEGGIAVDNEKLRKALEASEEEFKRYKIQTDEFLPFWSRVQLALRALRKKSSGQTVGGLKELLALKDRQLTKSKKVANRFYQRIKEMEKSA